MRGANHIHLAQELLTKEGMAGIRMLTRVFGWMCLLVLPCFWAVHAQGAPSSQAPGQEAALRRILAVKAETTAKETLVTVKGDGRIPETINQTFADPPRIVIDLLCAAQGFETQSVALDQGILERVRVGHHPDRIRIVLDIKALPLPAFSLKKENHVLHVALSHDGPRAPHESEGLGLEAEEKTAQAYGDTPSLKEPLPEDALPVAPGRGDKEEGEGKSARSRLEKLLDASAPDDQSDAMLFQAAVQSFREEDWMNAAERFGALLEKHPGSRYEEKASFLLANSYERLQAPFLSTHFLTMRAYYEDFLARFPESEHGAEALTAIGRLCLQIGYHAEALGYYGLAVSRDSRSPAAAEALEGQMRIHVLKRRFDEALAISHLILEQYPESPNYEEIRLETARILHELNRFQESLSVLSALQREGVQSAYVRPGISLYLGYNGYQLGNFPMARENLFRYCNVNPRSDQVPTALTKIGDAYREERRPAEAAKLYRYVAEHHSESEGALISQIRLAELQEREQAMERERGLGFGAEPGEKLPSPIEVYETMLLNAGPRDAKNPLVALALLRLAVLYQKEEEHPRSLVMIKELMERFPGEQLQREIDHVLLETLEGMVARHLENDDPYRAVGFYYEERDLFERVQSPELFMTMARVFLSMDLREDAAALFKKAGFLMPEEEKPSDLLYFLALDLYRKKQPDPALDRLQAAIERGGEPQGRVVSDAYRLKGRIMAEKSLWTRAADAFAAALRPISDPCTRLEILTETASVQAAGGMGGAALKTAQQAAALSKACPDPGLLAQEDLAEAFSLLGRPEKAGTLLEKAGLEKGLEKGRERILWKLAQSYDSQGRKEDSLSLYREIADRGDPPWRSLAGEKIEEIRFQREMDSLKKK